MSHNVTCGTLSLRARPTRDPSGYLAIYPPEPMAAGDRATYRHGGTALIVEATRDVAAGAQVGVGGASVWPRWLAAVRLIHDGRRDVPAGVRTGGCVAWEEVS
jgi:hypothetical protein